MLLHVSLAVSLYPPQLALGFTGGVWPVWLETTPLYHPPAKSISSTLQKDGVQGFILNFGWGFHKSLAPGSWLGALGPCLEPKTNSIRTLVFTLQTCGSNGLCSSRQDGLQWGITEKTLIHLSHSIKDHCIANHTLFPPTQQTFMDHMLLWADHFPAKLRMSFPPLGPCFKRLTLIKY